MKKVTPDYYKEFKCLADKCRHTCCAGWEIDVDEKSLAFYENVGGSIGQKLKDNIIKDDCPHFALTKDERCPFLNDKNLCELYLSLGESSLCQICSDHPRFRSYFSDRTEIGLELCCEAVGKIILSRKEKFKLIETDEKIPSDKNSNLEDEILLIRDFAIKIITERDKTIEERVSYLMDILNIKLPQFNERDWAEFFLSLERMDNSWEGKLKELKENSLKEDFLPSQFEIPFEQLLAYFIFRHLPSSQDEADIKGTLAFSILSYKIIKKLFIIEGSFNLESLIEISRLYSSEIEYSEENMDAVLNLMWDENCER